jgi:hypothetical protein
VTDPLFDALCRVGDVMGVHWRQDGEFLQCRSSAISGTGCRRSPTGNWNAGRRTGGPAGPGRAATGRPAGDGDAPRRGAGLQGGGARHRALPGPGGMGIVGAGGSFRLDEGLLAAARDPFRGLRHSWTPRASRSPRSSRPQSSTGRTSPSRRCSRCRPAPSPAPTPSPCTGATVKRPPRASRWGRAADPPLIASDAAPLPGRVRFLAPALGRCV